MPLRQLAPCLHRGCNKVRRLPERYCEDHKHQHIPQHTHNRRRTERDPFYSTSAWQRLRNVFIQSNPVCAECGRAGNVVDHIKRIKAGGEPFDEANLQTLCHRCHNRKRAKESQESRLK